MKKEIWNSETLAPKCVDLVVLCDNGSGQRYVTIAWLNNCAEWVDIPHFHNVLGWKPLTESEEQNEKND